MLIAKHKRKQKEVIHCLIWEFTGEYVVSRNQCVVVHETIEELNEPWYRLESYEHKIEILWFR